MPHDADPRLQILLVEWRYKFSFYRRCLLRPSTKGGDRRYAEARARLFLRLLGGLASAW